LDFAWSDEQLDFRREVIRFAKQELNYDMIENDHEEKFNREAWDKCAKLGIHGLPIPVEYGGGGADTLTTVCGLEALGYGSRDNGLIFSINAHMWSSEIPIWSFGTEEQKKKYLPKLTSGEWVGVHAMTEPMTGSDAYALKTRAERKGDKVILNGSKTFITNATYADMVIVFANLDPSKGAAGITAFIVEKGTPGFTISRKLHKMGLRTSPMAELSFVDCEVPAENQLGKDGAGPAMFTASMEWERICILASHLGVMQRLLETSVAYAKERRQFGENIGKFPAISTKIADMEMRLETGRLVLYKPGEASAARSGDCEGLRRRRLHPELSGHDSDSRRLRLHDRISDRARTARRDLGQDLLGHDRDSEDDHFRPARTVTKYNNFHYLPLQLSSLRNSQQL